MVSNRRGTHKYLQQQGMLAGMVDAIGIGVILVGIVLLLSGAALSVYGVGLLGATLGGGGGYLLGPTIAAAAGVDGLVGIALAVGVGALVGVAITYVLLSMAIAAMGFVVGTYLGVVVVDPLLGGESILYTVLAGLGTGVALAFLGMFLTRTTMIFITSFIGAALASRSVTLDSISEAGEAFPTIEPLVFEVTAPLFLGLFVLGVLSQVGLFKLGYVAKLVKRLPGASVLRDNKGVKS